MEKFSVKINTPENMVQREILKISFSFFRGKTLNCLHTRYLFDSQDQEVYNLGLTGF